MYFIIMKCRKQPLFPIPEPIVSVWEVIVDLDTMAAIQKAAKASNTTYSWIVRSCVFKMVTEEGDLIKNKATEIHSPKPISRSEGHRLQLCLYGDDEQLLKGVAFHHSISVSKLVRLALFLLLRSLFTLPVSKSRLVIIGLKKADKVEKLFDLLNPELCLQRIKYISFSPWSASD